MYSYQHAGFKRTDDMASMQMMVKYDKSGSGSRTISLARQIRLVDQPHTTDSGTLSYLLMQQNPKVQQR